MTTPASSSCTVPNSKFIGVDVGGTKVATSIMSATGFSEPHVVPTTHSGQEALIAQLLDCIEGARRVAQEPVTAVGIGLPSVIDFKSGSISSSVNIPLAHVPLRSLLCAQLGGLPVFIDNDATCAAIAEAHDERGQVQTQNLVMLTVGTGVGGGIVIAGRPYRGATGAAGELGHTIVGLDLHSAVPSADAFPQPGSLESLASGRALDALALTAASEHPQSALGELAAAGKKPAGPDVLDAARAGDAAALRAIELLGERLGVGIANAINTFDPQVVAIGGGVSTAGDLLLAPAARTAERFVLAGVGTQTEIRLARSGPQAGVRGAALMARLESSTS